MQKSNVKINWSFGEGALLFMFDFDNGNMRFSYRPEDGEFDIDPDSTLYRQAEWLLTDDEFDTLADWMRDQADSIIAEFDEIVRTKHQRGFVDVQGLLDSTEFDKHNA